jgi:hypothetical protein
MASCVAPEYAMAAPVQHALDQFRRIVDQDMVAQFLALAEQHDLPPPAPAGGTGLGRNRRAGRSSRTTSLAARSQAVHQRQLSASAPAPDASHRGASRERPVPVRSGDGAGATHEIIQPEERACTRHSRRPACDAPAC